MPKTTTRGWAAAGLAALLAVAGGCQTASLEDAAPTSASATPASKPLISVEDITVPSPIPLPRGEAPLPPPQQFVTDGIADTGNFPSVGTPRQTANNQLSAAEQAAITAEMERLKASQPAGGASQAEYEARLKRLRELAGTHAADAEREIVK